MKTSLDDLIDAATSGAKAARGPAKDALEILRDKAQMIRIKRQRAADPVALPNKAELPPLLPIETAPRDGTWILLFGESGYVTIKLRCEVGRFDHKRECEDRYKWRNHGGDCFTDGGEPPLWWLPYPTLVIP